MKRYLLVFVFLISLNLEMFSQEVEILNLSLNDSTQKILYIGVNNNLKIINTTDTVNFVLISNDIKIKKTSQNEFIVENIQSKLCHESILINLMEINSNDTILVKKFLYLIDRIPDVILCYGDLCGKEYPKEELIKQNKLKLTLPNCYYKPDVTIIHSEFIFVDKSRKKAFYYESNSELIPLRLIKKIKKSYFPDYIIIRNTMWHSNDGTTRLMGLKFIDITF